VAGDSFDQKPLALIIEDDRKLAAIFAQAINMAGFESETIYQGQAALARLAESSPQLVLLDLHLPGSSGQEILEYIRLEPHLTKTKVIIGTADPLLAENFQGDADLILIKPISFTQLRDLASRLHG
jgi:DNA-binding response OmpR family regulator